MVRRLSFCLIIVLLLVLISISVQDRLFPEPALAVSTTLTVLSGDDLTVLRKHDRWEDVRKTVVVKEGDSIKTGERTWALLTFHDGSTMELEPETHITVTRLSRDAVNIWQQIGRTWSGIKKLTGPLFEFEVHTPSASAVVRGTLLDIHVSESGDTVVTAFEGAADVIAMGLASLVTAGMEVRVTRGEAPQEPQPMTLPDSRMTVTVQGQAWALVVDPQERGVGVVPPGLVVNQVPRSSSNGAHSAPHCIMVSIKPVSGSSLYSIVLYGKETGGPVEVMVEGFVRDAKVFSETKKLTVEPYQRTGIREIKYVASLEVVLDKAGLLTEGRLGDFELVNQGGPGKVDPKDLAIANSKKPMQANANFKPIVEGEGVRFLNLSTGDFNSQVWDFGDGHSSSETNPYHVYDSPGEYRVWLTLTGPGGRNMTNRDLYIIIIR